MRKLTEEELAGVCPFPPALHQDGAFFYSVEQVCEIEDAIMEKMAEVNQTELPTKYLKHSYWVEGNHYFDTLEEAEAFLASDATMYSNKVIALYQQWNFAKLTQEFKK